MSLLNNRYVMDYVNSHKLLIRFVKQNHNVPPPVEIHAQQALIKLRQYLDGQGLRMPIAKFYYNPQDERTWRFIPYESSSTHMKVSFKNPNYIYKAK